MTLPPRPVVAAPGGAEPVAPRRRLPAEPRSAPGTPPDLQGETPRGRAFGADLAARLATRLAARLALPLAAVLLLATGCGGGEELAWRVRPLRCADAAAGAAAGCSDAVAMLGRMRLRAADRFFGPEIDGVEAAAGHAAHWDVDLGRDAHLAYVPLGANAPGCAGSYRVRVLPGGGDDATGAVEVDARPVGRVGRFAPPTAIVDLGRWRGPVRLELAVEAGEGGEGDGPGRRAAGCPGPVTWGHPRLVDRAPLEPPAPASEPAGREEERLNLVFIGLDTFRADRLGPRGKERPR